MQAGDLVEDFTLQNQDGEEISLQSLKAAPVVLFFYPRADTPGCTIESCGFRDAFERFQKAGITVLGISRDTVKAQKKFKDKYGLPYDLLADPDMVLIKRFDLLKEKTMYGKPVTGVERTTYVVGADTGSGQHLLQVFSKVTPQGHAEEVLALIEASGKSATQSAAGKTAAKTVAKTAAKKTPAKAVAKKPAGKK
jgi:peroxiredoxin Q/BCP